MTVDLTPIVGAILALASAAITAAIPIVVPALLARLKIANNSDLAARVETAADAAAGMAYRYAIAHTGGFANISVHDAAMATAINHVTSSLPDTLAKLGITPEHVEQMVTARLGVLLANDPSVTAGKPVTAIPAAPPAPEQT